MTDTVQITRVDYRLPEHATELVALLDDYALDPMGGGEALPATTRENLCARLAEVAGAFSLIATVDGKSAGLINCFMGFSTFKCAPLVNIHDVTVRPAFRGKGVARQLLAGVEKIAQERGCCKLTLEVLTGNSVASSVYRKFGFEGYELDPAQGTAEFWQKVL